jgi:hypothetical protein
VTKRLSDADYALHQQKKEQRLRLAVLARNARLRAWKGCGVPVEGGWRLGVPKPMETPDEVFVGAWGYIWCGLGCPSPRPEGLFLSVGEYMPGYRYIRGCVQAEERILREYACEHLRPLLTRRDPVKVSALAKLELLAGGDL